MTIGGGSYSICLRTIPSTPLSITYLRIDTDTSELCLPAQPVGWTDAGQTAACFVTATTMNIQQELVATGTRPLVLVVETSISIVGMIDAASHVGENKRGPGTPPDTCVAPIETPCGSVRGGAGGAGGAFMSFGGTGGYGDGGCDGGVSGKGLPLAPPLLRAGCDGQRGGDGVDPSAPGGYGGGALFLVAGESIDLGSAGVINASGAGGFVGGLLSGGSGGGTGGMIVMYAPSITAAPGAVVMANGGGGGAGQQSGATNGSDPDWAEPLSTAPGGRTPGSPDGVGGTGAAGDGPPQGATNHLDNVCGAGAGGGGRGFIQANTPIGNALTSPTVVIVP